MKILWITNIMLPPICETKGLEIPVLGGWMYSSLKRIRELQDLKIAVATVWQGKNFESFNIDGVTYYLLPLKGKSLARYNSHLEAYWKKVKNDFNPDIVHIHGSEFPHGLAYVNACGAEGAVVSIQGIISSIARYYTAGIDFRDARKYLTFRDFVRADGILKGQKNFEKRGRDEIELLQKINHIIGRTEWDKAHTWAINPCASYYHVGETLRDSFYNNKWKYEKCVRHSIFISQASYPVKGLHILLKAMTLVLRQFPDSKVYVAGSNPTSRPWYRITGYGKYLKNLIKKYNLKEHIEFIGPLDERAICQRYLTSNLFVCCSSIENSPNSLGEAQLLGVPYITSYCGGTPEIVKSNPEVLYRFEEAEMLAKKICDVFNQGAMAEGAAFDCKMYDGATNTQQLVAAYKMIFESRM